MEQQVQRTTLTIATVSSYTVAIVNLDTIETVPVSTVTDTKKKREAFTKTVESLYTTKTTAFSTVLNGTIDLQLWSFVCFECLWLQHPRCHLLHQARQDNHR